MLVFSEHDLLKDPPFSKLDLISCRNLLIYLDTDLQKRVIPLFHYALNPGGLLFLGTSETVGDHNDLFATIDRKAKLYQRKMEMPGTRRPIIDRFLANRPLAMAVASPGGASTGDGRLPLRELTERTLLQQFAPAAALVDASGDIHFVHGRTGRYLEPAPGEAGVSNILKMARDGLRRDLTTAMHKAALGPEVVSCPGLRVRTDDDFVLVDVVVTPVGQGAGEPAAPPLFLVSFSDAVEPAPSQAAAAGALEDAAGHDADADPRITALKQELRANQEYLQAANEELETANEELRSSNEEMQSVNEELQSTNEELTSSKEEMQSMNEELLDGQRRVAGEGDRPLARQQRHEQPPGRLEHRHRVRGPSAADPALHAGLDPDHQPDPGRHRPPGGPPCLQPWSATTGPSPTCRRCWTPWFPAKSRCRQRPAPGTPCGSSPTGRSRTSSRAR
ncbi:MAG: hypothetical protein IPO18_08465 [bacterium]|nr:hypothetical protein [bacterium]